MDRRSAEVEVRVSSDIRHRQILNFQQAEGRKLDGSNFYDGAHLLGERLFEEANRPARQPLKADPTQG